jgi:hypothetical protein
MRTKLTALAVLCTSLALGVAAAQAGPVTIALYTFETPADSLAFHKGEGAKCKKKAGAGNMTILLGAGSSVCAFRSSVVASADDVAPDQEVSGVGVVSAKTPRKIQKKAFVGVNVRESESAGYELRVRPVARSWQLFRDPKGSAGPTLFKSGKGKFIRQGAKPNALQLRAFDFGTPNTSVIAAVNGKTVVSVVDSGADQPDGRRNGVSTGVKGTGSGAGVRGLFDNVAIKIPNPF